MYVLIEKVEKYVLDDRLFRVKLLVEICKGLNIIYVKEKQNVKATIILTVGCCFAAHYLDLEKFNEASGKSIVFSPFFAVHPV